MNALLLSLAASLLALSLGCSNTGQISGTIVHGRFAASTFELVPGKTP